MGDIKTKFIGLELKSPIIAASCGLTSDINRMQEMEINGIGAVILKSIFEEQINMEIIKNLGNDTSYPEETDYIQNYVRANAMQQHIDLVKLAKSKLHIPVIASINCLRDGEWISFAKELEAAGADAIELNAFVLPLDEFKESSEIEQIYYDIVKHVKSVVKIPVIIKISPNFTNIPAVVSKLKAFGADAVTIFNRFYEPDIDIERETVGAASVFSLPTDMRTTLRWTGILAGQDKQLQLAASTGVHSGEAVVKLLLAGATTVQICSAVYEQGVTTIRTMNHFIAAWMEKKSYRTIEEFRGKLSYSDAKNADRYERAQFMKYFSDRK